MSNAEHQHVPGDGGDSAAPSRSQEMKARPVPRISIQAFCEDQATSDTLQSAAMDRRLAKTHVTVQMGGLEAAAKFYQDAPTPNLIIVESKQDRSGLQQGLQALAAVCDSGTKVIVIGHINDVLLYRELMQQGVSEYIVAPIAPLQIMETISELYADPDAEPVGQSFVFVGAKGGSGSSTVCHNTAWAIAKIMASDILIADFDLPFGTAGLDFNQDPLQGIADALSNPERLDEVVLDRLLSKCTDHLSLFAAPGTLDRDYDLSVKDCEIVLDVVRNNLPYVAIDLPHLWTSWARQIILNSDEVVITAVPDLANLRNAKNLMDLIKAERGNDGPPMLVLNQVGLPKRPEISVADFSSALEIEPTIVIDYDAQTFGTAANNGQMIEEVSTKARAGEQFRELALKLTNRAEQKTESKSLLGPLLDRLNLKKTG